MNEIPEKFILVTPWHSSGEQVAIFPDQITSLEIDSRHRTSTLITYSGGRELRVKEGLPKILALIADKNGITD